MAIKKFTELKVWQKAHELVLLTYKITRNYPEEEKFSLVSQSRRAAVSIAANISEGFKKRSKKDSLNFYNVSEGSLEELKYHFLLAKDLNYLGDRDYLIASSLCEEVGKLLNGWMGSQRNFCDRE